jgi:hypothetical protein
MWSIKIFIRKCNSARWRLSQWLASIWASLARGLLSALLPKAIINPDLLSSIENNYKDYFRIIYHYIVAKFLMKKVVVVFLQGEIHYGWVRSILTQLRSQHRIEVQLLSPTPLETHEADRIFPINKLRLSNNGHQFLPIVRADFYITPADVPAKNIPIIAPKIIIMHSLISLHGHFKNDTFDDYDYIFCAGKHHIQEFRNLFIERGITGKCLIPGGYPKLDEIIGRAKKIPATGQRTVIFAPTLLSENTEKATLMHLAPQLISWFLANGWAVLFRPHPVNILRTDKYSSQFEGLINHFSSCNGFIVDNSADYFESYSQSTVMVSDVSGTAYTYAFGFERPVIFVESVIGSVFAQGSLYKNRDRMSYSISTIDELPSAVNSLMLNYDSHINNIKSFREEYIFNVSGSAEYFSKNIFYILNRKVHPDWIYI